MKQIYYHYTTNDGAASISEDLVIHKSKQRPGGRDVRYGEGVYLTQVVPSAGKRVIAYNNYDGRNRNTVAAMIRKGKVNWYIQVELDDSDVIECPAGNGRDVYLYPGDLELTPDMRWEIGETA